MEWIGRGGTQRVPGGSSKHVFSVSQPQNILEWVSWLGSRLVGLKLG